MQKYLKAKVLFIFTLLFTMQANGQSFAWHNPLQENNYVIPQFRSIIPCEVLLYIEVAFLGFIH